MRGFRKSRRRFLATPVDSLRGRFLLLCSLLVAIFVVLIVATHVATCFAFLPDGFVSAFMDNTTRETESPHQPSLQRLRVIHCSLLAGGLVLLAVTMCFVHRQLVLPLERIIVEREKMQQELTKSRKLESIGQLAAGIAHEINTPIQCVGANVQFLRNCHERLFKVVDTYDQQLNGDPKSWEKRKDAIEQLIAETRYDHIRDQAPAAIVEAFDAVNRVIEIVRAMKAMSHPGTKEKVSTDVNDLIRNAATVSRSRWKYVARIEFDLDESLPSITAFPGELGQVLINLIVNAADAIVERNGENSDRLGHISIQTSSDEASVRIEVADNGCGIDDDVKKRVFDQFFTTKGVGKGTGQGLAITYDVIVKKHGGCISLESTLGKGTKFSVILPNEIPQDVTTEKLMATAT
jgi:signal transduction histidine kinase